MKSSIRGKYAAQACQECRRRRAKCDGIKPSCSRCTQRRLSCAYADEVDHRGSAPRSLVLLLQNRIKLLEQVIQMHSIDVDASIAQIRGGVSPPREQDDQACPATQSLTLETDANMSKTHGAFYSEAAVGDLDVLTADQVRFFGSASGRLDLRSYQAAFSAKSVVDTSPQSHASAEDLRQGRFNAFSQSLTTEALQNLSPDLVEHLIDLYFEWEQPWYQIVDEKLFRDSWRHNGRYFSPVLLCCIIAVASRYSDRPEVRSDPQDPNTAGLVFLEHAEALLHFDLKWPSITTVQSLAIMAIIYAAVGSDAAGWLHHGMAIRLITDMGLNIDTTSVTGSACLNAQDIQLRRQIYWTLYCSDKLWASYTGRVCTMLDCQGSVPLPDASIIGEQSPGPDLTLSKNAFLALFHRALSTQCQILESVLTKLYAPKQTITDSEKQSFLDSCLLTLHGWLFSLPKELKVRSTDKSDPSTSSPHVLILHMVYHTTIILLAKPFVSTKSSQGTSHACLNDDSLEPSDETGDRVLSICHEAATEICLLGNLFRKSFGSFRRSPLTATHCTLTACLVKLCLVNRDECEVTQRTNAEIASCMLTLRELSDSWTPPRRYWQALTQAVENAGQTRKAAQKSDTYQVETESSSVQNEDQNVLQVHNISPEHWDAEGNHLMSEECLEGDQTTNPSPEIAQPTSQEAADQVRYLTSLDQLDLSAIGSLPWDYAFETSGLGF